jgi:hypothetical protein
MSCTLHVLSLWAYIRNCDIQISIVTTHAAYKTYSASQIRQITTSLYTIILMTILVFKKKKKLEHYVSETGTFSILR